MAQAKQQKFERNPCIRHVLDSEIILTQMDGWMTNFDFMKNIKKCMEQFI